MKKFLVMCATVLVAMNAGAAVTEVMTCAEAAAAAALLDHNVPGTDSVAIIGYVTNTDGTISKGQQTFWMDDEKGSKKTFEGYWCNLPADMVAANSPLNVGDRVQIAGFLMRYNSTYEMKNGIVTILERATVKIDTIQATVCEAIEEGESLNDGDISAEVFEINDIVAVVENNNDTYHTQTFTLECVGDDTTKIIKPYNLSMQGDYCVPGDSVRILGKLKKYGDLVEVTGQGWVTKKGDLKIDTIDATVDEAVAAGLLLDNNMLSKAVYAVTGYVDSIASAYSDEYKNMSFYMCDDMSNPKYEFEGFQITVPADNQPKVGDKVKVTGNILHYYKAAADDKPEIHTIEIKKGDFEMIESTGLQSIKAVQTATKSLKNGRLMIEHNGMRYNAQGARMK
ncbi:MAG: hypothetical protein MJZ64_08010 [Paludibacteraceae bacterium]|nr:hypothetical protein [Paludibacteraceae bacterium]